MQISFHSERAALSPRLRESRKTSIELDLTEHRLDDRFS